MAGRVFSIGPGALLLLLSLSGCVQGPSCQGQPPGEASALSSDAGARTAIETSSLVSLQCWADSGNQISQYLLGYAYEYGLGTTPDRAKAIRAYQQAATPRSNRTYIYSPAVGKESHGRVIPVTTGPDTPGLPQARAALARLGER
ncbi:SEL1-like repeat protein [Govanella unica]|uniref:SEL1-like repeat protein n=1 Tax=Govanella unica TaxID=2975056 RepID=A0A9X3TXT2_9PROT|nr:SEL1-like repeat protein [Govania unica]MDA5193675.1 SEL1-like repeat protein [Govania unica]